MPTTTNFGWTTPADTDLVKDGAAAIRTLGNGVDSSFLDLKGGTSGQILAKNSATDLDFVWIANDQGDITAVTAGTGISGGGTSGAVTITNSMATEITASGDIIVGTGSGTFDNLPIGTTGQVLTADTTVSPYKVKWASASSSFVGCSLNYNADFAMANTTNTALPWNGELFDTSSFHDTSTNNTRITIPTGKTGYYLCFFNFKYNQNSTGIRVGSIRKNGTDYLQQNRNFGNATTFSYVELSGIFYLNAADYIECVGYQDSGGNINVLGGTSEGMFGVQYLGA